MYLMNSILWYAQDSNISEWLLDKVTKVNKVTVNKANTLHNQA